MQRGGQLADLRLQDQARGSRLLPHWNAPAVSALTSEEGHSEGFIGSSQSKGAILGRAPSNQLSLWKDQGHASPLIHYSA